ncbi:DNA mismatch repair protein MutS [Erysipelothrix larvae]|uniref:DNA mismatch repair protein MutS n=1 Tax=Erysipelothrix larvae TaxID=1514105 RepID=A0A0X8GXW5_9FIRM|nr:DNA mismatch repair protein MutS [Erysipelothrix larvae]AMC92449.1 DNA mismatch repair protein MutS [Erysipelothrix larvae]
MNKETLTPMLQQYMEIKENTNDALVFYRLGDFYELFFDDAIIASKVLDLVLTSRGAGKNQKAPMCGVPYHASKSYIQKLISNGYKVAIVEQVEDPKEAKGLVRREVVEVVTPGTYLEQDDSGFRQIASLTEDLVYATFVMCDISSGSMRAIRVMNQESEIIKIIKQYSIFELVVGSEFSEKAKQTLQEKVNVVFSTEDGLDSKYKHQEKAIQTGYQRLVHYLFSTQKRTLMHLSDIVVLNDESYMRMDYATLRNLELLSHESDKTLSLYSFVNRTHTTLGSRLLREDIMQPLVSMDRIKQRHHQIETLQNARLEYHTVISALSDTYDIQRVIARISTGKCNAQDLVRLKKTLGLYHTISDTLKEFECFNFITQTPQLKDVYQSLDQAIFDDAPVQLKDGKTFKPNINKELDELITLTKDGKKWLLEYEAKEKEKTGIKNLKVGYTRAFGYYIEISKGQVQNVDDSFGYIRRQTLTNVERYISEELQTYETKILKASDRILEIEQELLKQYVEYVSTYAHTIHTIGDGIARLDVLCAYTEVSSLPGYVKPTFSNHNVLKIENGRHPVLEVQMGAQNYVANDATFSSKQLIKILTGPNMGGKSTYMRMVAINVILAQMGCFVPCDAMELSIVDQIFTRMGANDDILLGQSTFMIEMIEAQNALMNATAESLILFDEIGRGTATYDGMALAQAIVEYLAHIVHAKTIFSTHYHELVALEKSLDTVTNIHVEVHEENEHVTFLYKVVPGGADRSYGINVARLAHLPNKVIEHAKENLVRFEAQKGAIDLERKVVVVEKTSDSYRKVQGMLAQVDVNQMTPLEALTFLAEIQKEMRDDNG